MLSFSNGHIVDIEYYLKKARRAKKFKRRRSASTDDSSSPDLTGDGDSPPLGDFIPVGCGGEWWGAGATMAGLEGLIKEEHLKTIFDGIGPDGRQLVQNARHPHRQKAWDAVFSVPKSVSVLWSQSNKTKRRLIEECIRLSAHTALKYVAEVAIFTRRGKGGKILERALPIVAIFPEALSKELQPQLHSHCVIFNVAGRSDGTFGAILSEPFYRHKLTAGALFSAQLAYLLGTVAGLALEKDTINFRVKGVPAKLVDHYSLRSKQIREKLQSKGYHSAKAAEAAAMDTRKEKPDSIPSLEELLKGFRKTNATFGFTDRAASRSFGRPTARRTIPVLKPHIQDALDAILEIQAYFSEQELIRGAAHRVMAEAVPAVEIVRQVRSFLVENREIIPLGCGKHEPLFSTREMIELEQRLLADIRAGRGSTRHIVPTNLAQRIIDELLPLRPELTEDERKRNNDQRNAALHLTTRPGDVLPCEGVAGAGKT